MTIPDTTELRRKAEAAKRAGHWATGSIERVYCKNQEPTPDELITLLDSLDAAREEIERLETQLDERCEQQLRQLGARSAPRPRGQEGR